MRKLPMTMTNTLQATISCHLMPFSGRLQLSYSHMKPIGWKDMRVPKRAPIRDTSPPKTGIALAMT